MKSYLRVLRGGSWVNGPVGLRSAFRYFLNRSEANDVVGFRLVLKEVNQDRALRGGSWFINGHFCRGSFRGFNAPDGRSDDIGFRLTLRRTNG